MNLSENKRDIGYDFVRFIAMLMILLHHLLTTFWQFHYSVPEWFKNTVTKYINFGGTGVALFFILSGALLIKRYKVQFTLSEFFYKRFIRIEIPQMIGFICAFALMYCITPHIIHINPWGIFVSLLGLNYGALWQSLHLNIGGIWVIGEWFTPVIIICYLFFPFLRRCFLKSRLSSSIIITILFFYKFKSRISYS